MEIVAKNITRESLGDIPRSCRECPYWELPEDLEKLSQQKKSRPAEEKKKEWFIKTLERVRKLWQDSLSRQSSNRLRPIRTLPPFPQVSSYKSGRIELYLKKGFKIKDETKPEFPLLRLEL